MPAHSIRERILLAVLDAVRAPVETLGATLHRSPTVAISREQCPALVVFPESDAITERANHYARKGLDKAVDAQHRAKKELERASDATATYVEEQPLKSIAMAAGIGAAAAALIMLLRERD